MLTVGLGPPLGYVIGGILTSKLYGSYTNPKIVRMLLIIQVIRMLVCLPAPLMNIYWPYFACLWLSSFTEGLLIPNLVGMIINTVSPLERPMVYSISLVIEKLFGMTLGPQIYGFAIDIFPHFEIINGKKLNGSRIGMYILYWSSIFGVIFTLVLFKIIPKEFNKN